MATVIFDTSSWINLAKPKFQNILKLLIEMQEQGRIEILTNEIINDEWDRNKDKTIKSIKTSIKDHAVSAAKILEFLDEDERILLEAVILKYRDKEKLQIERAEEHFNKVDQLLRNATIVPISNDLMINMSQRAIIKKAPFHNSKNNMADALIIFSAIDWVHEHKLIQKDLIFISHNHTEFSNPQSIQEIHDEINADSKSARLIFTNDIGRILNVIEEEIDDNETQAEFDLWNDIEWQAEVQRGR
jgi:hypothetical protein